ncbi:MAG: hypothetical protein ABIG20_03490 [archaeon]
MAQRPKKKTPTEKLLETLDNLKKTPSYALYEAKRREDDSDYFEAIKEHVRAIIFCKNNEPIEYMKTLDTVKDYIKREQKRAGELKNIFTLKRYFPLLLGAAAIKDIVKTEFGGLGFADFDELYRDLMENWKQSVEHLKARATKAYTDKKYTEAYKIYRAISASAEDISNRVEEDPQKEIREKYGVEIKNILAQNMYLKGKCLERLGKLEEAAEIYRKTQRLANSIDNKSIVRDIERIFKTSLVEYS